MTSEQFGGFIRALVQLASGYCIAKGIGDTEFWLTMGAGAASVAAAWWSWKAKNA